MKEVGVGCPGKITVSNSLPEHPMELRVLDTTYLFFLGVFMALDSMNKEFFSTYFTVSKYLRGLGFAPAQDTSCILVKS